MTQTKLLYSRDEIAALIVTRIDKSTMDTASAQFKGALQPSYFVIDDLLPVEVARAIFESFPSPSQMRERKTLREHKYVASQMNRYHPLGEEALFAFQHPTVVQRVGQITGMQSLEADPMLYAGGLSLMGKGNFLNPHLDNSHNKDRSLYRVLNLLYYVSPQWTEDNGGHLELWPHGTKAEPVTVVSRFNRLVVMTTGPQSWHSVSEVRVDLPRCCVSNYYFSSAPVGGEEYHRVTTFRGRPEQPVRDLVLRVDAALRQGIRALKPDGLVETTHVYDRSKKAK